MFSRIANSIGWSLEEHVGYIEELEDEYDVFLSFKGEDTRKGFIDHLYIQLTDAGFSVFKDDVNLPIGQDIATSLNRAIKRSRIVIPILSENYAASRWCLIELACMMECRKTMKLKVVPIFYDVTPSQVRRLTGSYATSFSKHLTNYDLETVDAWKKALEEVASLKGLELANDTAGCEGQFTKLIVAKVSDELNKPGYHLTDDESRRMKKHVANIKGVIEIGRTDKKVVAITGSGTDYMCTIVREFLRNFRHGTWEIITRLRDIRKTVLQPGGLERLVCQIFDDLSMEGDERVKDLRYKFRNKKVLIVLEDVADTQQLDALAGSLDWFGSGSRVIVTMRNRDVCNAHQVTDVYHVGKVS